MTKLNKTLASPNILVYQSIGQAGLCSYLESKGFGVISAGKSNVMALIKNKGYHLCIIDYPADDSLDLLNAIKRLDSLTPVIVISEFTDSSRAIMALSSGADDFIRIPYNTEEVICRINNLLKRNGMEPREIKAECHIGRYTLYEKEQVLVYSNGGDDVFEDIKIRLTNKQALLLGLLATAINKVIPYKLILSSIWCTNTSFTKRSLDVVVCALRGYLNMDSSVKIETVRGIGLSLTVSQE
jgi:DNA-binding response OmpR family regulator